MNSPIRAIRRSCLNGKEPWISRAFCARQSGVLSRKKVERQQQKIVGKNIESMVLGKSVFDHKEYRVFLFLGC